MRNIVGRSLFLIPKLPFRSNMGGLFALVIFICGITSNGADSAAKFIEEFCNPIQNNQVVPRKGIFAPPNINCPTYAIICQDNGLGFLEYCPFGQVFFAGSCMNSPRQCSGKDEIDCSKYPGHQMVDKGCSSEFYWCTDGRMTKHSCQAERYFNPKNGQCDFFENVERCNNPAADAISEVSSTTEKSIVTNTEELHPVDCRVLPDGDYPDPVTPCSNRYFTCANSITFRRHCTYNLYFDPVTSNCHGRSDIAVCGGKPNKETKETVVETVADDICNGADGNVMDLRSDGCSDSFYSCTNGKATRMKCSDANHVFNYATNKCELKENVKLCESDESKRNTVYGKN